MKQHVTNELELFTKLLKAAQVINDSTLTEAVKCAKNLEMSLENALTMLKVASEKNLQPAITAKEMVVAGKISLDEASHALKNAFEQGISFEEALPKRNVKQSLSRLDALTFPLAEFLLTSKLVTEDQLNQAIEKAKVMDLPLGKTLVVNRFITRWSLGEVINAARLVKDNIITKEQAFDLLRHAVQQRISVIQVLFEQGNYNNPKGETLTLLELLTMANCITEVDYQDVEERELLENKTYPQIITERKIIDQPLLQASISLLEMVGNYLQPFQAAEALKQVKEKKIPIYQAIVELKPPPQVPQPQLRLGDLLVESGIVSRDSVEKVATNQQAGSTLIRIGKYLLDSHLISDTNLYYALRCQSLYKEGILSAKQAVAALSYAHDEKIRLEDAFAKCGIFAPIRMQWSWQ